MEKMVALRGRERDLRRKPLFAEDCALVERRGKRERRGLTEARAQSEEQRGRGKGRRGRKRERKQRERERTKDRERKRERERNGGVREGE